MITQEEEKSSLTRCRLLLLIPVILLLLKKRVGPPWDVAAVLLVKENCSHVLENSLCLSSCGYRCMSHSVRVVCSIVRSTEYKVCSRQTAYFPYLCDPALVILVAAMRIFPAVLTPPDKCDIALGLSTAAFGAHLTAVADSHTV